MGKFLNYWNDTAAAGQSRFEQVGLPFADNLTVESIVNEMLYYTPSIGQQSKVLEVGCGNGLFLEELQKRGFEHLMGVDYSEEMIAKANHYCNDVKFMQLEAHSLAEEFQSSSFDLIYLHSVTQYFDDQDYFDRFLDSSLELLSENGYLYIGDVFNTYIYNYNIQVASQRWKSKIRRLFSANKAEEMGNFYLDLSCLHRLDQQGYKIYPLLEWINSKPLDFKAYRYNLLIKRDSSL